MRLLSNQGAVTPLRACKRAILATSSLSYRKSDALKRHREPILFVELFQFHFQFRNSEVLKIAEVF